MEPRNNVNVIKDKIGVLSRHTEVFDSLNKLEGNIAFKLTDVNERVVGFKSNDRFIEQLIEVVQNDIEEGYAELNKLINPESQIVKTINLNHYEAMVKKNWGKTYWLVDIHGTILKPNYTKEISTEFYPYAKETLQLLSKDPTVVLILYTCSYPEDIKLYMEMFEGNNIHFDYDYTNNKPLIDNTTYGFYEAKPYCNVLIDDKAGFNPEEDWGHIKRLMESKKVEN